MTDFDLPLDHPAVEAGARAAWEHYDGFSWDDVPQHIKENVLPRVRAVLRAALPQLLPDIDTEHCEECDGAGYVPIYNPIPGKGFVVACPAGCCDGRVRVVK